MIDTISDMLTRIRNANLVKKAWVVIPYTKKNYKISKILEKEGFIHCATATPNKELNVSHKKLSSQKTNEYHENDKSLINNIEKTTPFISTEYQKLNKIKMLSKEEETEFKFIQNPNKNSTINQNDKKYFRSIVIALKYIGREKKPNIHTIKQLSKPSLRWYTKNPSPNSLGGLGIIILSTSSGLMTDKEARSKKLGGELILEIW